MAPSLSLRDRGIRALFLDLDGTVYFRGEQIPDANDAIQRLRASGLTLRFLTNIDSRSVATIRRDVAGMGVHLDEREIFTPVVALHRFLQTAADARCYFLLSPELTAEFARYQAEDRVSHVIVGDQGNSGSYERLNTAFRHVMGGAEIVALQKGRYVVRADGYYLDTGAFVTMLEYASGKMARVLGKPSRDFFELALRDVGCGPDGVAVVGDDVTTDIAGAKGIGATAVLVRTGKYRDEDLQRSAAKPDLIIDALPDLVEYV